MKDVLATFELFWVKKLVHLHMSKSIFESNSKHTCECQVSPDLYGDNNTRLFTYWTVSFLLIWVNWLALDLIFIWTLCNLFLNLFWLLYLQSDAYQATGCYNLLCSGFIQVSSAIAMGASISPVSALRNSQYDISILIWKVKIHFQDFQPNILCLLWQIIAPVASIS